METDIDKMTIEELKLEREHAKSMLWFFLVIGIVIWPTLIFAFFQFVNSRVCGNKIKELEGEN